MRQIKRHMPRTRQRGLALDHDAEEIFDSLGMGTLRLDRNMRIAHANSSAADILQKEPASLEGKYLQDFFPPSLTGRLAQAFVRALKAGSAVSMDARFPGPLKPWVSFRCMASRRGYLLVLENITENKQVEEALRTSEANYRTIFDSANDAIFIHDTQTGAILDVNRKMTERYGYTAEEARRLTVGDLSSGEPPYTQEGALEKIRQALHAGELIFEWQSKDKSGRLFWEEVSLRKTFINNELRIVAVARDITERKRFQRSLQESRRSLITLMNNLPGMAYRCRNDTEWTMEFCSLGCLELTGYQPEDLVGNRSTSYASLIHPDDRARVWNDIQDALRPKRPFRIVYRIRTASSQEKWVWEQGQGVFSTEGNLTALEGFIIDITEREKMEERLRESEQRLMLAQKSGRVGIFDWDMVTGRYYWSDEMRGIYRLPPDFDTTFDSWKRLVHPDDLREGLKKLDQAISEHRREVDGEYRIVQPDGGVRWYADRGVIYYDESGRPVRIIGTTVDITDRKETQDVLQKAKDELDLKVRKRTRALARIVDELKQQKEVLQTIIDNIPAMLVFINPEGRVSLINKEMEKVSGWSLEEVRNMDFIAEGFPDPAIRRKVLDAVRQGKPEWQEFEAVTRSGEPHPGLWTHVRLSDGSAIGIGIDIRARRRMEHDLQRLAAAIEQAGEGIALLNTGWVIEYVNPAFERISSRSRKELIGRRIEGVWENFFDAAGREELDQVLSDGKTWSSHQRRRTEAGEAVEVDLTVSPVRDEKGRIANYVSLVRDVTREAALRHLMAESQKMEAIGTLAGGIAHDLKNIFTPIVLNTEVALMDMEPNDPICPLLKEIQEAAKMGSDLTKHIVTFSRRNLREKKPLPITPVIEEALSFLRSALPATIRIHPRFNAGRAVVLADPTQIKQVVINLGNNAGHAMRKGGGELGVELSRLYLSAEAASEVSPDLAPGPYVRLVVRDTGEGMDEETLYHIFDPFFTTKNKAEGTGMGLSVVHGIIKDHNGAITVQSIQGRGSTFTVYLPRLKGPVTQRDLTPQAARSE